METQRPRSDLASEAAAKVPQGDPFGVAGTSLPAMIRHMRSESLAERGQGCDLAGASMHRQKLRSVVYFSCG